MLRTRIIPVLLLKDKGLVKGQKFKNHKYVGDPINAVKIFSTKQVHELFILDINASIEGRRISKELVNKIAEECYMPFGVGGGITSINDITQLLNNGAEKICVNSAAVKNPQLISDSSKKFGSQCIVVSIDVRKDFLGRYEVMTKSGTTRTRLNPINHAKEMERMGAGELLINSINKDGQMSGYDLDLLNAISSSVNIPVIACGGAGQIDDLIFGVKEGKASAVAAGSMFVYYGKKRAVLINYPREQELSRFYLSLGET